MIGNASSADAVSNALPFNTSALKAYAGNVFLVTSGDAKTTSTILCETSGAAGASTGLAAGNQSCTAVTGMQDVK